MGFSQSASFAILLIALVLAAGSFISTSMQQTSKISESKKIRETRELHQLNSEINITYANFDAGSPGQTSDNVLTVRVENLGTNTIELRHVELLVDGDYVKPDTKKVIEDGSTSVWEPGKTLEMNVTNISQPNSITVVSKHSLSEREEV